MARFSKLAAAAVATATLAFAGAANAAISVNWADLTYVDPSSNIHGTITAGADTVNVTYSGAWAFAQVTGGGTDYWYENPGYGASGYTDQGAIVNRPTGTDIIALNEGGLKTFTFDKAVVDPYLAFTSWNGNVVNFSAPFTVISEGCGYWGCGSFAVNATNDGFFGAGEVHGVLQFHGTFTSLSFTDSSEYWHGVQVGIGDVAGGVPEPAAWALMILGFGAAGAALRHRRRALAA